MKCMRCNDETNSDICPNCGVNKIIYSKSINISNKLYNKGLMYSKLDNISFAIDNLEISVLFDKGNFIARNLLGLCLYKIGRVTEAVMHWEISCKINSTNNDAFKYLKTCNRTKISTQVQAYNLGMEYLKNEEYDLAIIQIKKTTEINPNFVDGYNLLAMLYMIVEEKGKALDCVQKVLEIDNVNERALAYSKFLNNEVVVRKISEFNVNTNKENRFDNFLNDNKKKSNRLVQYTIGSFLIGVLITYIFTLTLRTNDFAKIEELELKTTKLEESNKNLTATYDEEIATLKEENEMLKAREYEYENALEDSAISKVLVEAELLLKEGKYKEAANVLNIIDTGVVEEEDKETFELLKNEAYSKAGSEYYNEGMSYMNQANYIEATINLEKALMYSQEGTDVSNILYNLAIAYEQLGEISKSIEYFDLIINDFSNSRYYNDAIQKKAELEG